MTYLVLSKPQS